MFEKSNAKMGDKRSPRKSREAEEKWDNGRIGQNPLSPPFLPSLLLSMCGLKRANPHFSCFISPFPTHR